MDTLGNRMKAYEREADTRLPEGSLWVIRLDGNSFSKFTKTIKAEKPYDARLGSIMQEVCVELAKRFGFVTVYTQSDEITCVPDLRLESGLPNNLMNLRVQKLASLVASYASVVFYQELSWRFSELDNVMDLIPTFDARVFQVPSEAEVYNAVLWRQRDCIKNAKNLIAQSFFSHRQLQGLTSDEQLAKVKEEEGVTWEDYTPQFRYGIFVKRVPTPYFGYNPKTKEVESTTRFLSEAVYSGPLGGEYGVDWLLRKYNND